MFEELNGGGPKFTFQFTEDMKIDYISLKDLHETLPEGDCLTVDLIYPNKKGKYGLQYVAVCHGSNGKYYGVNIPTFCNDTIEKICATPSMVGAINTGHCGLTGSEERKSKNGFMITCPVWKDI